tara:strand:- start:94 stop:636 length:543 start_codon:yes stop_codon:yes gene_type:complete
MTITETNYITAHFIDNERKNIHVLLKSDDGTSVYPYILEYNPDDPICQEFLKLCSLDQLHENTWQKKKEERKDFVSQVKRIAQKEGLIKQVIEDVDSEFMTLMMDFLLSDKKEHIDRLFNFKIFLFEHDIVKNYKDENKKTAIRKAKTPLEALKLFIEIWEENKKTTNQSNQVPSSDVSG